MTLKEAMEQSGIGNAELARLTDIPLRTIEDYKAGRRKPGFENGLMICDILNVDPHNITF